MEWEFLLEGGDSNEGFIFALNGKDIFVCLLSQLPISCSQIVTIAHLLSAYCYDCPLAVCMLSQLHVYCPHIGMIAPILSQLPICCLNVAMIACLLPAKDEPNTPGFGSHHILRTGKKFGGIHEHH